MGDGPSVKVTADSWKRIVLLGAKPGDVFDLQQLGEVFQLTLLKPARPQVRLVKEDGYTVAAGSHPITAKQVRATLDEFP
jgi:hypothetical protein